MAQVKIENLSKKIGEKWILEEISLRLEKKKIYGLIGNNGAGKTSFFRALLGLTPYTGRIYLDGQLVDGKKSRAYLREIGVLTPLPEAYDRLTIQQVFEDHLHYMGVGERIDRGEWIEGFGLSLPMDTKISDLSLGMKQKLNMALALSHHPQILILDEPFNGLDRRGIDKLKTRVGEFKEQGKLVVIASHSFRELEDLIDHLLVLEEGRLLAEESLLTLASLGFASLEEYFKSLEGVELDEK